MTSLFLASFSARLLVRRSLRWLAVSLLSWVLLGGFCALVAEHFWFEEVGYVGVFWKRLALQVLVFLSVTGLSGAFLVGNLALAERLRRQAASLSDTEPYPVAPSQPSASRPEQPVVTSSKPTSARFILPPYPQRTLPRYPQRYPLPGGQRAAVPATLHSSPAVRSPVTQASSSLPVWIMFGVPLSLGLGIGLVLMHWGYAVAQVVAVANQGIGTQLPLPPSFRPTVLWQLLEQLLNWQAPLPFFGVGLLLVGAIALLVYPHWLLWTVPLVASLGYGVVLATHWSKWLQWIYAKPFGQADPILKRDISFYIFGLPIAHLLEFWLLGLTLLALLLVGLRYLLSEDSLNQGRFPKLTVSQRQHLYGLAGLSLLAIAFSLWLSRYRLFFQPNRVMYGAGYTDVTLRLPAYTVLSILAVVLGVGLLGLALQRQWRSVRAWSVLLRWVSMLMLVAIVLLWILPPLVQWAVVRPNELDRERPYLQHTIASTRRGFDLDSIQVETFNPNYNLTYARLQANPLTVRNIRLWDTRPLLRTNRQLQQIRPYYRFYDADIDRYPIPGESSAITSQQVLISARELDYSSVPPEAKTWVNEHLVYTHGYGFTLSPVNRVAPGGLPDYFVKDIGADARDQSGSLSVVDDEVAAIVPVSAPRIYFGELTDTYVITSTHAQELDYPSGNDNVYNTYDGAGGIEIGRLWQQWLFARYFNDAQLVFTNSLMPQSKLLFRRNIMQRVRAIAPMLQYDTDPYLVVADINRPMLKAGNNTTKPATPNYLYWILDAYTTSTWFPYSDPGAVLDPEPVDGHPNYIRNSVKVVVDAYNGSVQFYVATPNDPLIQTWQAAFPRLFQPLTALPKVLQNHLRYPQNLFSLQSERLMTYHMTDPQVFYNREDQWHIPREIYGTEQQAVEPYFVIMNLPTTQAREEFILLLPYTPSQRTNLSAWLAARSDGEDYGKLLLYRFPKQQQVFGPEQIEARINQDPVISERISLWNRKGSRALQGNLLVIPIEQSLIYVEPLYLEAEQNSLPTLIRVIAAYENRIAMAETLEEALKAVFQDSRTNPAIIRPVEETPP